jgi:mannose-6-phosphate isomerase
VSKRAALSPARLAPVFVPRIWGAESLAPLFSGKQIPEKSMTEKMPIGEVWLSEGQCVFAEGPYGGRGLAEAWSEMSAEWAGTRFAAAGSARAAFPLLAKFLFPGDKLSVQVHPPDEYAREHEAEAGGTGKTEMWFAVHAKPRSEVFVGLKPGVTRQVFRRAMDEGTVENCLARLPLATGDAVFVPAGTAHTIGPGVVLCEIQQTSDVTYRVHDYGRLQPDGTPRALHVAQAMDVLNFEEQRGGKISAARVRAGNADVSFLVACPYFAVEKWEFVKMVLPRAEREQFEIWIVLAGNGGIAWGEAGETNSGPLEYSAGEAWFVPASLGEWRITPATETIVIRTFVPQLDRYAARLAAFGVAPDAAARVIHK